MPIKISHQFDAGAIDVLRADDPSAIDLNIRKDSAADIVQWFYFRVQGAKATPLTMNFLNAGQAAYPDGWKDYQAAASYDRETWFRVPTSYDGKTMVIEHTPEYDSEKLPSVISSGLRRFARARCARSLISRASCGSDLFGTSLTTGTSTPSRSISTASP